MESEVGKKNKIPGYFDTGEHAYKERNLETYQSMVFRDSTDKWLRKKPEDMVETNPMQWSMRHFHAIELYLPEQDGYLKDEKIKFDWDWPGTNVYGGLDEFFKDGSLVLDLGSGHGQVVHEINDRFSGNRIKCIGVDARYEHDQPENKENLVTGNFAALPFADHSFNRLLSVESFPAWLPDDKALITQYFNEITRISQPGTIWRGTLPSIEDGEKEILTESVLINEFTSNGWHIVIDKGGNSFIAKLGEQSSNIEVKEETNDFNEVI
jgi:SAM-dependent methyltransferase